LATANFAFKFGFLAELQGVATDYAALDAYIKQLEAQRDALLNGDGVPSSPTALLPAPIAPPTYVTPGFGPSSIPFSPSLEGRQDTGVSITYHAAPVTLHVGEFATKTEAEELARAYSDQSRVETITIIEEAIYGASN
jgi:hypothetical protein